MARPTTTRFNPVRTNASPVRSFAIIVRSTARESDNANRFPGESSGFFRTVFYPRFLFIVVRKAPENQVAG